MVCTFLIHTWSITLCNESALECSSNFAEFSLEKMILDCNYIFTYNSVCREIESSSVFLESNSNFLHI